MRENLLKPSMLTAPNHFQDAPSLLKIMWHRKHRWVGHVDKKSSQLSCMLEQRSFSDAQNAKTSKKLTNADLVKDGLNLTFFDDEYGL